MKRTHALLLFAVVVGVALVRVAGDADAGPECRSAAGDVAVCVHGADEPPPGVDLAELPTTAQLFQARFGKPDSAQTGAERAARATASQVGCIGDGRDGPRVQVVYARTATAPDRYDEVRSVLQQYAADADDAINASAGQRGAGRRVRWVTEADCQIDVLPVTLSEGAVKTFAGMREDLVGQGLTAAGRKYLVFVDAAVGVCGVAESYPDERPGQENYNNSDIAMYARVDTPCWPYVATHELLHTLGGVQAGAPNSTGIGHCTDEQDVLCYADGSTLTMREPCPQAAWTQVDCNHDDYFNPSPEPGTYLASSWNVADSRFLDHAPPPPRPVTGSVVAPPAIIPGTRARVAVELDGPKDRAVDLVWSITQPDCRFGDTQAVATSLTCPAGVSGDAELHVKATDTVGQTVQLTKAVELGDVYGQQPVRLTVRSDLSRVKPGRTVTLVGTVTAAAGREPLAGMPISVWARPAGSSSWRRIGHTVSDFDGRITAKVVARRSTRYALRSPDTQSWSEASAQKSITATPKVTLRVKPKRSHTRAVAIVRPAANGSRVILQHRQGGVWRTVAKARVTGRRTVISLHPASRGMHTYRVVVKEGASYTPTKSPVVRVRRR